MLITKCRRKRNSNFLDQVFSLLDYKMKTKRCAQEYREITLHNLLAVPHGHLAISPHLSHQA